MPRSRPPQAPRATLPYLALLAGLAAAVALALLLGLMSFTYRRLGMSEHAALVVILLTLVGSWFDIPVARFEGARHPTTGVVRIWGVSYLVPLVQKEPDLVLAVNVGGALIPACVGSWLLLRTPEPWPVLAATAAVTLFVHLIARPVPGVGVVIPGLAPPAAATIAALAFASANPAPVAYVAGTFGTLIGADILNLGRLRHAGAAVASVGGAGTFDGIFLTGLIAALLAALA